MRFCFSTGQPERTTEIIDILLYEKKLCTLEDVRTIQQLMQVLYKHISTFAPLHNAMFGSVLSAPLAWLHLFGIWWGGFNMSFVKKNSVKETHSVCGNVFNSDCVFSPFEMHGVQ